ncbi:hypothetical protein ACHAQA_006910 [Verticillium albo-atrum]
MSSPTGPTPQEQPDSIGDGLSDESYSDEDYEDLSPAKKIQLEEHEKWGWVIYRCSYAKEFDAAWETIKRSIQRDMRDSIAGSDVPGILETMEFVFVEDPSLEDASVEELRRRFQAWARDDSGCLNMDNAATMSRGARYEFFIRVDDEGLWGGYVGLARSWPESPGSEDFMKLRTSAVAPDLYAKLSNPEMWWTCYKPPQFGVCNGY